MKSKKSNKSGLVIVILLLISIGLGSFIAYDKFLSPKEEESTSIKLDNADISIENMFQLNEILNLVDNAFNDSTSKFFGYPYRKKLYTKNFDKEAALFVSMYDEMEKSGQVQHTRSSIIKTNYEKIFGDYLSYEQVNFDGGNGYKVEFNNNDVAYIAPQKSNDLYKPEYMMITTKINIEDNKAIITRKLAYVEYTSFNELGEATEAIIYNNSNKGKEVGKVKVKNGEVNKKQIVGSYGSKLSTYLYTFTYTKSNFNLYKINEK